MGYRSEMAYVIEPVHIKAKQFLADFAKENKEDAKRLFSLFSLGSFTVTDTQIRFKADWIKWYDGSDGYPEVNAHIALVRWAEDRAEDAYYANQGAFGRVENIDDNEVIWWGDEGYELVSIRVELVVAPLEEVSE